MRFPKVPGPVYYAQLKTCHFVFTASRKLSFNRLPSRFQFCLPLAMSSNLFGKTNDWQYRLVYWS